MAEGFYLELDDYCSFCSYFEPDIEKVDITTLGDRARSYTTTIKCINAYKCKRISENMRNKK
ncbi:hypothetical protein [Blautia producta]|uniref:Uncharacterized protein n=2 Tax=Blautia producta TaxID=33035 RepID=A0A7G5N1D2_9FIRM|nr:hypothetical protein [Blautia producta]QIB56555.1 hypothetical protein GXM18_17850 [Blautia producta ATCC 27340 = DSM 2950]QMW80675.1 hypothetical protein E5259_25545 [Blautia producta]